MQQYFSSIILSSNRNDQLPARGRVGTGSTSGEKGLPTGVSTELYVPPRHTIPAGEESAVPPPGTGHRPHGTGGPGRRGRRGRGGGTTPNSPKYYVLVQWMTLHVHHLWFTEILKCM